MRVCKLGLRTSCMPGVKFNQVNFLLNGIGVTVVNLELELGLSPTLMALE